MHAPATWAKHSLQHYAADASSPWALQAFYDRQEVPHLLLISTTIPLQALRNVTLPQPWQLPRSAALHEDRPMTVQMLPSGCSAFHIPRQVQSGPAEAANAQHPALLNPSQAAPGSPPSHPGSSMLALRHPYRPVAQVRANLWQPRDSVEYCRSKVPLSLTSRDPATAPSASEPRKSWS